MTWAQRLKRVFNIDMTTCEQCGGPVRVVACIEDPEVIQHILVYMERRERREYGRLGHLSAARRDVAHRSWISSPE